MFDHPHDGRIPQVKVMPNALARPSVGAHPAGVADAWSAPVDWALGGTPVKAIHVAQLPDGRLSMVSQALTFTMTPTPLGQPLPIAQAIVPQMPPLDIPTEISSGDWRIMDSLYCTAQTLLADGRLFSASGTRYLSHTPTGTLYMLGLDNAMVNAGAGWSPLPSMVGKGRFAEALRWYPTATRLADKRVLVLGGYEMHRPWAVKNLSAEVFDPAANAWTLVSPQGALPEPLFSYQYTHVFQLPAATARGDVLAIGDAGIPGFMNASGGWALSAAARPGSLGIALQYLNNGTSALLPLRAVNGEWGYANGSVLAAGGQNGSSNANKIDVYDPVADAWTIRRDMERVRAHPASVVLPDARILILGGEDFTGSAGLGRVQYVDPRNGFSVEWGASEYPEVRGYHNIALLLPDGRVLFGSGNENYTRGELPSFRYYSPSYMSQPRPVIEAAPSVLSYGNYGWVTYTGSTPPAEVVLVGLGAMTHSFDMSQRYVQLPITGSGVFNGHNYSLFTTPADARVAPPGHYMLFILDANLVPSVAKIVQVQ